MVRIILIWCGQEDLSLVAAKTLARSVAALMQLCCAIGTRRRRGFSTAPLPVLWRREEGDLSPRSARGTRTGVSSLRRKAAFDAPLLRSSVSRGSDVPPAHHSPPLPFKSSCAKQHQYKRESLCDSLLYWCGQEDLNLHRVAPTRT